MSRTAMVAGRERISIAEVDELMFVAMEGREGGQMAIESTFGLVTFGESKAELIAAIIDKVHKHFNEEFAGKIRLREFTDTVIEFQ